MTDAGAPRRTRDLRATYGIDPADVGNITWDTMRSKVSLPSTPVNAVRWIMPDGTKIGTHDDDQHITLAGDDYRTLITAGAIRVRGQGEDGLIEMGRLPTPAQEAALRDLYRDKKTIHLFLRRTGGVWRQGDNVTVEGISSAEGWFSDKFGGVKSDRTEEDTGVALVERQTTVVTLSSRAMSRNPL